MHMHIGHKTGTVTITIYQINDDSWFEMCYLNEFNKYLLGFYDLPIKVDMTLAAQRCC